VRKTIARLLLLRSPGEVFDMKAEQFEIVDEPHSHDGTEKLDGCGFIPDSVLLELVERMGKASGGLGALRAIIKEEGFKGKVRRTRRVHVQLYAYKHHTTDHPPSR